VQEFECRKDAVAILSELMQSATEEEVDSGFSEIFFAELCQGYEWQGGGAVALSSGTVLRASLKHRIVAQRLLNHYDGQPHTEQQFRASLFKKFLRYVGLVDFEVASDAFTTFRAMLMNHPTVAADFMETHFDEFFLQYGLLLKSGHSYVTRRQSLKILVELLLMRPNFKVMSRFVQSTQHLRTVMQVMREPSAHIRLEAFHLFKLFVGNPKKPPQVVEILSMNRAKLLSFFATFVEQEEAIRDEVNKVIRTIEGLQPLDPPQKQADPAGEAAQGNEQKSECEESVSSPVQTNSPQ